MWKLIILHSTMGFSQHTDIIIHMHTHTWLNLCLHPTLLLTTCNMSLHGSLSVIAMEIEIYPTNPLALKRVRSNPHHDHHEMMKGCDQGSWRNVLKWVGY